MVLEPNDSTWYAALGTAFGGLIVGIKWWFHVRRLSNADKVDGSVTRSIEFVLAELRAEIERLKTDNADLRMEVASLKAGAMLAAAAAEAAAKLLSSAANAALTQK